MPPTNLQAILFDLGGVLVEWDGIQPLLDLTGGRITPEQARRFWLESPAVRQFETGNCSPQDFAEAAVAELQLDLSPANFIVEFTSWDRGSLPGSMDLLDRLKSRWPLYCLSNNNSIHWALPHIRELTAAFAETFVSFQMGLMKPDEAAFEYVAKRIPEPADRVLFLDDNPECVEAAMRVGFVARQVYGVAGVEKVLGKMGMNC